MYSEKLTAYLTGATLWQLGSWRRKRILLPELRLERPPLYSFRDLAALRTIAYLRRFTSAQGIAKAFETLNLSGLTEHPSEYRFGTDGKEIFVETPEGNAAGLVKRPGSVTLFSFEEISETFQNFRGREVVDLRNPSAFVELEPRRLSGIPTVRGTRVDIHTVLSLVDPDDSASITEFVEDFPGVSAEAIDDVLEFDRRVREVA